MPFPLNPRVRMKVTGFREERDLFGGNYASLRGPPEGQSPEG